MKMADSLTGIRVCDFGWVLAGAIPGQLLADMGAEVIKIESKSKLEFYRRGHRRTFEDEPSFEQNPWFHNINRGKLSITVDLTTPKGSSLLKELVKTSDVVIENFSARVLERFGLDYPDLVEVKPDIIMLSITGAGRNGPLKDMRCYATSAATLSGLDSLIGYPGEDVLGIKMNYADLCAALQGLFAVLAALHYRRKTGKGQHIDVSMWESVAVLTAEAILDFTMNNRVLGIQGNRHPIMVPHNLYRCKGEDKWVSIAIKTEEEWRSFCQAIGKPDWVKDERFSDKFKRMNNVDHLDKLITEWTVNYTPYEVMDMLQEVSVAAVPHMGPNERFHDRHYQERETYVYVDHPVTGSDAIYNQTWKMSETPGRIHRAAPLLGEHNNYVFGELLHLSADEIAQLVEERVIY